jgi:hypothetical protein
MMHWPRRDADRIYWAAGPHDPYRVSIRGTSDGRVNMLEKRPDEDDHDGEGELV